MTERVGSNWPNIGPELVRNWPLRAHWKICPEQTGPEVGSNWPLIGHELASIWPQRARRLAPDSWLEPARSRAFIRPTSNEQQWAGARCVLKRSVPSGTVATAASRPSLLVWQELCRGPAVLLLPRNPLQRHCLAQIFRTPSPSDRQTDGPRLAPLEGASRTMMPSSPAAAGVMPEWKQALNQGTSHTQRSAGADWA